MFECGAVQKKGRLPEALFMVFYWIPKVQKCVNLVDLVKSFHVPSFRNLFFKIDPNSNEYLLAKIGVDTAENRPLKVCQKLVKNEKTR